MENQILGLHHITAIATQARENFEFYTRVLGLRMVKKTVNFDDPGTYHLYYGNESGTPGTILTFFPWQGIGKGRNGAGMATEIGYAVPQGSLPFWKERLTQFGTKVAATIQERFGEPFLAFEDPDGLVIHLIEVAQDDRSPWTTEEVNAEVAIKGFHKVALTLRSVGPTAHILTEILDYTLLKQEGSWYRYVNKNVATASMVDIYEDASAPAGYNAGGTNHHIAFRVANETILMAYHDKVQKKGLNITGKIDRDYFFSLYFREPGGVLFEIATDNPGFTRDEPLAELGTHLKLPKQYEGHRSEIEKVLPSL